jgi:predicted nucleic acid-binding protein
VIVVDASVLTDALVDDGPQGDSARGELAADPQWAAPGQLIVEVVSAIRGKVLGGTLRSARAGEAIAALPQLVVVQVGAAELVDRMWQLRHNLSAYDAAYVAAAEALGCSLVTGDARLAKAAGVRCRVTVIPRS